MIVQAQISLYSSGVVIILTQNNSRRNFFTRAAPNNLMHNFHDQITIPGIIFELLSHENNYYYR